MMMICAVGRVYFFHDPHMKSRLQQLVSNQIEGEYMEQLDPSSRSATRILDQLH